ncbi:MAG: phosphoribosylanthranilate isomerase [Desulfovibrio sp.]|nr:phosphoribosylanthranilate isomerase [Desulfovibrio sp.]
MLIKICGLTRHEDVQSVRACGADFCGFIFHAKSPRAVDPAWVATVDSGSLQRVGVFVEQDAKTICEIMRTARLDYAQLHGTQSVACAMEIGPERVIRVLWPQRYQHKAQLYAAMQSYATSCAYYLFDAGFSGGGHGFCLEWADLSGIEGPHPWFLAGGLHPGNVLDAVLESHASACDLNSGIESSPGRKDEKKMRAAIAALRSHFAD